MNNLADFHDPWTWLFWFSVVGLPVLGALCIGMMHATMPPRRK